MKEGSAQSGSERMEVAEKQKMLCYILFWLHHYFDTTQPIGYWQCCPMGQSTGLELRSKLLLVTSKVIHSPLSV